MSAHDALEFALAGLLYTGPYCFWIALGLSMLAPLLVPFVRSGDLVPYAVAFTCAPPILTVALGQMRPEETLWGAHGLDVVVLLRRVLHGGLVAESGVAQPWTGAVGGGRSCRNAAVPLRGLAQTGSRLAHRGAVACLVLQPWCARVLCGTVRRHPRRVRHRALPAGPLGERAGRAHTGAPRWATRPLGSSVVIS